MKPNVILIVSDQHRRDASACYGNEIVKTPNIDKIASCGMKFTRAYCPSPLCAPSRAAMLTGRYPCHSGALYHKVNGLDPGYDPLTGISYGETIARALKREGYQTAAIGKMHVHGETSENDLGFEQRENRYYTYRYAQYEARIGIENVRKYNGEGYPDHYNTCNRPTELTDLQMYDAVTVECVRKYLAQLDEAKPLFLHVGLEKPHPPWWAETRFHEMYDPEHIPLPQTRLEQNQKGAHPDVPEWQRGPLKISDEQVRASIAAYYANVSSMDEKVGQILDALHDSGRLKNTYLIYLSDHGDNLYEHGMVEKHCFYEGSVGIPLIIAGPGIAPGVESKQLASAVDLYPTILDLLGIPQMYVSDGISLKETLEGGACKEREIFSELYNFCPQRMIIYKNWKYVLSNGIGERLFNVQEDLMEVHDLSRNQCHDKIRNKLKQKVLQDWPTKTAIPEIKLGSFGL